MAGLKTTTQYTYILISIPDGAVKTVAGTVLQVEAMYVPGKNVLIACTSGFTSETTQVYDGHGWVAAPNEVLG